MYRELVHLYGPFSIHSFGVMIALGVIIFVWLAEQHPLRKKYMTPSVLIDVVIAGICFAVFGGRLLYVLTEWGTFTHWVTIFNIWEGGFSLLGAVITCALFLPFYVRYLKVPILPCLDLIGLYAPLLQGISRVGCFLAGCCYGKATSVAWSITYATENQAAPSCIPLHPTQLYSAALLILIFFILTWIEKTQSLRPGQPFALYLMMTSAERFFVDFFRGDQEFFNNELLHLFAIHQWISLLIFGIGLIVFLLAMRTSPYASRHP